MLDRNLEQEIEALRLDAENAARARASDLGFREVTREEHKAYVGRRLRRVYSGWKAIRRGSLSERYESAAAAVGELSGVPYHGEDIAEFCEYWREPVWTRSPPLRLFSDAFAFESELSTVGEADLDPAELAPARVADRDLGVFVSALINHSSEADPIQLRMLSQLELDHFGYRLARDVIFEGNLGDNTACEMQSGNLRISGNCNGIVGSRMSGGEVIVSGSIRDIAAVRYGGSVSAAQILEDYHDFSTLSDLVSILKDEPLSLLIGVAQAISSGSPVLFNSQLTNMLHRKLLGIICNYNISCHKAEIERASLEIHSHGIERRMITDYYENRMRKYRRITLGSGVAGVLLTAIHSGFVAIALLGFAAAAISLERARTREWKKGNLRRRELSGDIKKLEKKCTQAEWAIGQALHLSQQLGSITQPQALPRRSKIKERGADRNIDHDILAGRIILTIGLVAIVASCSINLGISQRSAESARRTKIERMVEHAYSLESSGRYCSADNAFRAVLKEDSTNSDAQAALNRLGHKISQNGGFWNGMFYSLSCVFGGNPDSR